MADVSCLVCNRIYDGTTHCSVTVCRACAMFFIRYAKLDTSPLCKGNKQCKLEAVTGKNKCIACRYQRCLDVGLKRQANSRSTNQIRNQELAIYSHKNNGRKLVDLEFSVTDAMPMLKKYCYYYALNANATRAAEYELLRSEGVNLIQLQGNKSMGLMTMSISKKITVHESAMCELKQFLYNVFPAFSCMEPSAKDTLFHTLMFLYFDLFSSFNTMRIFNDVNSSKLVCSEMMFADLDNMQAFLECDRFADPMDFKVIEEYLVYSWRNYLDTTHKLMHRMKITDVEYLAACALITFDEDHFLQLPNVVITAEKHRYVIYKELDYYYRKVLHLENYVERIMNIKELLRVVKSKVHHMKESVHLLRTFNFYEGNEEMWDVTEKIVESLDRGPRSNNQHI